MRALHAPLSLLLLAGAGTLAASERELSYTYTSAVLAPGQKEIELWGTFRTGREYYYRAFDNRLELEYGLAENVQAALYLNFSSANSDPDGTGVVERDSVNGISAELKWKLSDAVADAVGSALYIEPEISGHEAAIELKGILDKRVGSELFALNLTLEPEWELEPDAHKPEFIGEITAGWSHRLSSRWALGLEFRDRLVVEYADTDSESEWEVERHVIHGGPALHAVGNGMWATLSVMPQLYAFRVEDGNSSAHRERLGAENLEVRALVGLDF